MVEIPTSFELEISDIAFELLESIFDKNILYRSCGVFFEDFSLNCAEQLFLFSDDELINKRDRLSRCFDNLEKKFGKNIVKIGYN